LLLRGTEKPTAYQGCRLFLLAKIGVKSGFRHRSKKSPPLSHPPAGGGGLADRRFFGRINL